VHTRKRAQEHSTQRALGPTHAQACAGGQRRTLLLLSHATPNATDAARTRHAPLVSPPAPSLMPPNQRVTSTTVASSPAPSMAFSMGRPAVPPGSPSSLHRKSAPTRYAQQLWRAPASAERFTNASASAPEAAGAARAMKRLFLTSVSTVCAADSVS
jgi:hypothetical protein